jgi:hypothetical protein
MPLLGTLPCAVQRALEVERVQEEQGEEKGGEERVDAVRALDPGLDAPDAVTVVCATLTVRGLTTCIGGSVLGAKGWAGNASSCVDGASSSASDGLPAL